MQSPTVSAINLCKTTGSPTILFHFRPDPSRGNHCDDVPVDSTLQEALLQHHPRLADLVIVHAALPVLVPVHGRSAASLQHSLRLPNRSLHHVELRSCRNDGDTLERPASSATSLSHLRVGSDGARVCEIPAGIHDLDDPWRDLSVGFGGSAVTSWTAENPRRNRARKKRANLPSSDLLFNDFIFHGNRTGC